MLGKVMRWFGREPVRPEGQSCESCCYFIDHRDRDDPKDEFGYCGHLVATLGLEEAVKVNEYGGHWTHSASWCANWQGGEPLWRNDEAQSRG